MVVIVNEENQKPDQDFVIKSASVTNAILSKVQHLYGDFGIAAMRSGFVTKYCNARTRVVIVRARHGPHKFILSVLPCITSIDKRHVALHTVYTGATIRHCYNFIMEYQKRKFDEFCANLKTDEEKLELRNILLNFDHIPGLQGQV